jgi:hypothetical protein
MKKYSIIYNLPFLFLLTGLLFINNAALSQTAAKVNPGQSSRDNVVINVETWVYIEGALIIDIPGQYMMPMLSKLNRLHMLPGQSYTKSSGDTVYMLPGQPFNAGPWDYFGSEGILFDSHGDPNPGTANYPITTIDWVLLSLRTAPDAEPVCRKAALLHTDGHVELVDGGFSCQGLDENSLYYLVIEHRNHMIVMSPEALEVIDGTISWDFRYADSYIFDPFDVGYKGQKELLPAYPGVFAMNAANGCQGACDLSLSDINLDDRTYWERQNRIIAQYFNGDYNMSGDCNFNDRILWEYNNGIFTSVP